MAMAVAMAGFFSYRKEEKYKGVWGAAGPSGGGGVRFKTYPTPKSKKNLNLSIRKHVFSHRAS